ncbi:MAG: hypothetical protein IJU76_07460 [Desulfovibrionaceae bacterium]|nr:hypothetical protein [Desulfovibrionaceae bacterium]
MSLHGVTKGTGLEKIAETLALGEAHGVMMYYALARLAKEEGYDDIADDFILAANQEAVHAGFYATLNGKYPKDFWGMVRGLMAAETGGEARIKGLADKFRASGLTAAADKMEVFAKQEGHHGALLKKILEKYRPELLNDTGAKVYVCACCGYEYVGDLDGEPENYVCPVCGQPKRVFHLKEA